MDAERSMTVAVAPAEPVELELLQGLAERARETDLAQLDARLRASGGCARPIRLKGRIETCDGHGHRRVWSTATEPDGVLRKACGNRREAVCAPCAERYRQDAYHLIIAGLRGGKGVPDTIAQQPAVFLTLTAPSFGVVHTRRLGADGRPVPCRPRRDDPVCPHGVALSCRAIHAEGEGCLGEPLCPRCFDYDGAVTWNNSLGALWRYTTIYVPRAMARLCEMTQDALKREVRPAYVKVAEFQRRGLVHVHVLARLDRAMPDYRADQLRPPAARFDVDLLSRPSARPSPTSPPRSRPSSATAGSAGATSSTSASSRPASSAGRSRATSRSTRPRAPNRPAGCCVASTATTSTRPPYASTCAATYAAPSTSTSAPRRPERPSARRRRRRPTSKATGTRPRSRSAPAAP
jgi:hypothetical protein